MTPSLIVALVVIVPMLIVAGLVLYYEDKRIKERHEWDEEDD